MSEAIATTSAASTRRVAAALARSLSAPRVILLQGDLGAGKTTFVQGFVHALQGGDGLRVQSPTFALARTYPTEPPVQHLDLYRIEDPAAAHDLGLLDMLSDDRSFSLVEWPEQLDEVLNDSRFMLIEFSSNASRSRRLWIRRGDVDQNALRDAARRAS
jgi:tRNA threonylcarbamoyl adenosine modification protein YjeE